MTVIQTTLEIPDDIALRLLTGEYVRHGGVVRDLTGRLVKHLNDASPWSDAQETAARGSVAKALSNPRSILIGLSAVAVAATAGSVTFWAAKRTKRVKPAVPRCVENYNASLAAYLEAARNATLDAGVIDRLIADLDVIEKELDDGKITLEFSREQSETLVGMVAGYTSNLAEANQIELHEMQEQSPDSESGTIIDLRHRLKIQGQIFNGAARSN